MLSLSFSSFWLRWVINYVWYHFVKIIIHVIIPIIVSKSRRCFTSFLRCFIFLSMVMFWRDGDAISLFIHFNERCRYNAVHCDTTFHAALCWLNQNLMQSLNSQNTLPYFTDELWGVYCKDFGEKLPCCNGTTMYFLLTYLGRDKWPPFSRRHFQMHFLEWKCVNFD